VIAVELVQRLVGALIRSSCKTDRIRYATAFVHPTRKGFGTRALVGACLVKGLFALPTWTWVAALIAEHPGLQAALGDSRSVWAMYRFARKLRAHRPLVAATLGAIVSALRAEFPEYGKDIAIDASDLSAYANGQRYVSKGGKERERFSDPNASWGHRSAVSTRKGGGFYGYRLQLAVCTRRPACRSLGRSQQRGVTNLTS
jgi:hypothetical protein